MSATAYRQLIASKQWKAPANGFEPANLNTALFDWQKALVRWACRKGRAAIFADCGLGKTLMQCAWAHQVMCQSLATNGNGMVLILAPLAVASQTVSEAARFGIEVIHVHEMSDMQASGIYITNYDRLERFLGIAWDGVVLDESSILKSYTGKMRNLIIESFAAVPYKLACTATPSPNDHMELGNHAEFLGVMSRTEMLCSFFVHDGGETTEWRLKGHAQREFWSWVAGWAVMMRRPSDIGFSDEGYDLPPLRIIPHVIQTGIVQDGCIFAMPARTLEDQRAARRETMSARVESVAQLVNYGSISHGKSTQPSLVSCEQGSPKGSEERLHSGISEKEPGEVESDARAAGQGKRSKARKIRSRPDIPSGGEANGQDASCVSAKGDTPQNGVRPDSDAVPGDDGQAEQRLCDLRIQPGASEAISVCGSLPQVGEGSRDPLCPVQLRTGINEGQSGSAPQGGGLPRGTWLIFCELNEEGDRLAELIPHAVQVAGSDSDEDKSDRFLGFAQGRYPVLICKPKMAGFGLNFQHCARIAFVGLSHSYEQFYQSVRRCWRFGQQNPVEVHIMSSDLETEVLDNINRKQGEQDKMVAGMVKAMGDVTRADIAGTERQNDEYKTGHQGDKRWDMYLGDCVEHIQTMEAGSIHYSIFSPPFASLYTYSNSPLDMGNCKDHGEFFAQFIHLTRELFRVLMAGRLVSFHCMNLPTSKERDGYIGITDFRGILIRAFQDAGFIFHSEVCIWKDPVTAMQRTKALGLLHKTIRKDSSMSRQGIADYLVTMRKPGENPERIPHGDDLPVTLWQNYASPVWMDITPSDTLQKASAREENDERHICPLQLSVIERAIHLWSNPGDLVLSPFAGIGSEGYVALKMGRRFIGTELKASYFTQAVANLRAIDCERQGQQVIGWSG